MKHFLLLIICILSFQFYANAKGKRRLLKDAYYFMEYNNFKNALDNFYRYDSIDSTNSKVKYAIGKCLYYSSINKNDAVEYFKQSDIPESLFYLGRIAHYREKSKDAIAYYQSYIDLDTQKEFTDSIVTFYLNKAYVAQKMLSNPRDVKMRNIGDSVNSIYPDYVPVVSVDETAMYFTSRRKGGIGNKKDPTGSYYEDIYVSYYRDGVWSKAQNIDTPINTETHESCLGISPDQKQMFIYRTNEASTGGGIYEVRKEDSIWSNPVWVDAEFNNLDAREKTICLIPSPDSSTYYFVSNKDGGFGGTDIYKIVRFANGRWSLPENLGPEINTPYDEDSPFFHPDANTLYFSSKGHENMGDYDIFVSRYQEDGTWSIPENLGYPLNTVGGDRFLNVSPDGRRGYYSKAVEPGSSDYDIFVAEIPDDDVRYLYTVGYIIDAETRNPVDAKLTLKESGIPGIYGIFKPNIITSRYLMILRPEVKYELTVTAKGYITETKKLYFPVDYRENEISLDFEMKKQ